MIRKARYGFGTLVSTAALALLVSAPTASAQDIVPAPVDTAKTLAVAAAPTPAPQLPATPRSGEMTFVFSDFSHAVYPGWEACPTGWAATLREVYLASVSSTERARLSRPENEPELTEKWKNSALGPNNTNLCTNYNQFPERPLQAQVQSKVAYGLDLDGDTSDGLKDPYVCAHDTFASPLGEKGVDNQQYRALGCTRQFRGPDGGDGDIVRAYKGHLSTGQYTALLLLRGVDSLTNDDNVEVILASSDQQPIIDVQQNVLPGASFHVSENPRWRNELRGRIVDGVLVTDSKDIVIEKGSVYGSSGWDLQRSKMRLAFRPDGTLEGLIGGYEPIFEPIRNQVAGGKGTIKDAGADCAGKWNTLKKLADGERDPKTGQCGRISSAYRVTAVAAFVFDRPPENPKDGIRAVRPLVSRYTQTSMIEGAIAAVGAPRIR